MPITDSIQSNKQHAVPQNIMEVEFKLIGDFTMRQFAYLVATGLISYIVLVSMPGIFKVPISMATAILGLALVFGKIHDRGVDEWIVNFFRAINSPTQRIWKKEPTLPTPFLYSNLEVVRQELITLAPTSSRRKLEEYLKTHDTALRDPLDINEADSAAKVRKIYLDLSVSQMATIPQKTVSAPVIAPSVPSGAQFVNEPQEIPVQPSVTSSPVSSVVTPVKENTGVSEQVISRITPVSENAPSVPAETLPKPVQPKIQLPKEESIHLRTMTPDMHSGRRFTNLIPSSGELVLPIRGERVLKTVDEEKLEEDMQEKAQKLQQLIEQIKHGEVLTKKLVQAQTPIASREVPTKVEPSAAAAAVDSETEVDRVTKEAEMVSKAVKAENEKLLSEISRLRSEIAASKMAEADVTAKQQSLQQLEEEKQKVSSQYNVLTKYISDLESKMKDDEVKASENASTFKVPSITPVAKIQPLTSKPNILSGMVTVKTQELADMLIIVKNEKSVPVRAFKPNKLGHFVLTNELDPGKYTLELQSLKDKKSFDIISVEVNNTVLPPVELKEK